MSESIYQLIYASAATSPYDDDMLSDLLTVARANNEKLGIGGMLLYHEESFIQALEGPETAVVKLYERIAADPGHDNARLLFRGNVDNRDFAEWSMGFLRSSDSPVGDREGFNRFLERGFIGSDEIGDGTARKALEAFSKGRWRQAS